MTKLLALLLIFSSSLVYGQETKKRFFNSFKGTVYKMPIKTIKGKKRGSSRGIIEKYREDVVDDPVLQQIELKELNIPNTESDQGFPNGDGLTTYFAMILESTLKIDTSGCYEFSLNSDDGSILWIDDQIIVDNDGGHGMRMRKDSVALHPGKYPAKLWYFQGHPTRFGLELDTKAVGPVSSCNQEIGSKPKNLTLSDQYYFEVDSYELTIDGKKVIAEFFEARDSAPSEITVVGHTDDRGTPEYNSELSINRAAAVSSYIRSILDDKTIQYSVIGKGESSPIEENSTEEGRSKNRRVEISVRF